MIKLAIVLIIYFLTYTNTQTPNIHYPEIIRIGIFNQHDIDKFSFSVIGGEYKIQDNNNSLLKTVQPYDLVVIEKTEAGIKLVNEQDTLFSEGSISFAGQSFRNTFVISTLNDNNKIGYRIYDSDLIIKNKPSGLNIINKVPFENYIAGVVQSESGFGRHPEYYNLQATISRTYAIKNLDRHKNEDFHLCDEVHCQAYYSKSIYPEIILATEYTRGDVIVDNYGLPINTVFHANCGGVTVNSEDVWLNATPYLKEIVDTFCIDKPSARWEESISKKELNQYLEKKLKDKFTDTVANKIYNFSQQHRKTFLDPFQIIHLGSFRNDFELRSTYFNMEHQKDSIILNGKGHGHGVGLCQEGAMEMANHGFSRDSIISFYYRNAIIKTIEN